MKSSFPQPSSDAPFQETKVVTMPIRSCTETTFFTLEQLRLPAFKENSSPAPAFSRWNQRDSHMFLVEMLFNTGTEALPGRVAQFTGESVRGRSTEFAIHRNSPFSGELFTMVNWFANELRIRTDESVRSSFMFRRIHATLLPGLWNYLTCEFTMNRL